MRRGRLTVAIFLILFGNFSRADFVTIGTLGAALVGGTKNTLYVFDLDGTLIRKKRTLTSEVRAFNMTVGYLMKKKGKSRAEALKIAWEKFDIEPGHLDMVPVETDTVDQINMLQSSGRRAIGLTNRDPALADVTLGQLQHVGIQLDAFSGFKHGLFMPEAKSLFEGGVIFAGFGHDKGGALVEFIKDMKIQPDQIVYVDNESDPIKDVRKALAESGIGIPFLGFYYQPVSRIKDCRVKLSGALLEAAQTL
jgi:uncharacterized protein DUF2608